MDTKLVSIYEGAHWHVVAFQTDGKTPTHDYLEKAKKNNEKDHDRLMARINMVADFATYNNDQVFNHEGDGIFAFKTRQGLRLYCFKEENRLIVTVSGSDKPKKKQQQKDIGDAKKWRSRYYAARKVKKIEITHEE
jgi:putative component of toxin-antitoxin plasmid stabilization module